MTTRTRSPLLSLNPPSEVAGEAGAQLIVDQGLIPAGAKVGILDSIQSSAGNLQPHP